MRILAALLWLMKGPDPETLMSMLTPATKSEIEDMGRGFDVEGKPPALQVSLLKEEIIWREMILTERQIDVVLYLALHEAIERAKKLHAEYEKAAANSLGEAWKKRADRVLLFLLAAELEMKRLAKLVKEVRDYELKFYL